MDRRSGGEHYKKLKASQSVGPYWCPSACSGDALRLELTPFAYNHGPVNIY